jgi:formylglycine-generating enzyme required for sulfatase activity
MSTRATVLLTLIAVLNTQCAATTTQQNQDATPDRASETWVDRVEEERVDASIDIAMDSIIDEPMDVAPDQAPDVVSDTADVTLCPRDPPSGPPSGTNRSCGDGGAPDWHCREVPFCGGEFTIGSTSAWNILDERLSYRPYTMRPCDVHRAIATGGYIDAYEVTVARFREWVEAGMPRPRDQEILFNGIPWNGAPDDELALPNRATADERIPGVTTNDAMCTWSPTHGVHDDLPINCVNATLAALFCWWDGKHIATEVGWEFVATNRGTTPTPFGAIPTGADACEFGDVGGYAGICPRQTLPSPVGSHPRGVTRDPPGVHDLWGGMQEFTIGPDFPYAGITRPYPVGCLRSPLSTSLDGVFEMIDGKLYGDFYLRGLAWFQSPSEHSYFTTPSTRSRSPTRIDVNRSVRAGIRCMRWVPEPR